MSRKCKVFKTETDLRLSLNESDQVQVETESKCEWDNIKTDSEQEED